MLIDCANMPRGTRLMDDRKIFTQFYMEFLRVFSQLHGNSHEQDAIVLPKEGDVNPLNYFHGQIFPGEPFESTEAGLWPTTYQDIWGYEVDPQIRASLSYAFTRVKSLFLTSDGRLGSGPAQMQVGDTIFVLPLCIVPVLLRKANNHYLLVGVCFVLGLMDGEIANIVQENCLEPSQVELH
jgi:hypothetical protein